MVRVLAANQCGPGSIPGPGVICGLSLLLVVAPRVLSLGSIILSPQQLPTLPNCNSIRYSKGHGFVTLVKQSRFII